MSNYDDLMAFYQDHQEKAKKTQGYGISDAAQDLGVAALKGGIGIGQSAVGLGNIASGGLLGNALSKIGYDSQRTNDYLNLLHTDPYLQGQQAVQQAGEINGSQLDKGLNTLGALIANPMQAAGAVAESLPLMAPGMAWQAKIADTVLKAGGKEALLKAMPKIIGAGAAMEGAQTAGQIADQAQQQGRNWSQYAEPALTGGLITGGIAAATGLGLGDVAANLIAKKGFNPLKGAMTEGVVEELPQSVNEQVQTNRAMGNPNIWEGTGAQGVQGLVAGGLMGGLLGGASNANAVHTSGQQEQPPAGILQRSTDIVTRQQPPSYQDYLNRMQGQQNPGFTESQAKAEKKINPLQGINPQTGLEDLPPLLTAEQYRSLLEQNQKLQPQAAQAANNQGLSALAQIQQNLLAAPNGSLNAVEGENNQPPLLGYQRKLPAPQNQNEPVQDSQTAQTPQLQAPKATPLLAPPQAGVAQAGAANHQGNQAQSQGQQENDAEQAPVVKETVGGYDVSWNFATGRISYSRELFDQLDESIDKFGDIQEAKSPKDFERIVDILRNAYNKKQAKPKPAPVTESKPLGLNSNQANQAKLDLQAEQQATPVAENKIKTFLNIRDSQSSTDGKFLTKPIPLSNIKEKILNEYGIRIDVEKGEQETVRIIFPKAHSTHSFTTLIRELKRAGNDVLASSTGEKNEIYVRSRDIQVVAEQSSLKELLGNIKERIKIGNFNAFKKNKNGTRSARPVGIKQAETAEVTIKEWGLIPDSLKSVNDDGDILSIDGKPVIVTLVTELASNTPNPEQKKYQSLKELEEREIDTAAKNERQRKADDLRELENRLKNLPDEKLYIKEFLILKEILGRKPSQREYSNWIGDQTREFNKQSGEKMPNLPQDRKGYFERRLEFLKNKAKPKPAPVTESKPLGLKSNQANQVNPVNPDSDMQVNLQPQAVTAPAEHIEQGQAEPATNQVIQDSAETVNNSEKISMTQARENLTAQINAALLTAKSEQEHGIGRNKKGTLVKKVRYGNFGGIKESDLDYADLQAIGYVTFDVKGDGKFKVLNTKEHLEAFKAKVEKQFKVPKQASYPPHSKRHPQASAETAIKNYIAEIDALSKKLKKTSNSEEQDGYKAELEDAINSLVEIADSAEITDNETVNSYKRQLDEYKKKQADKPQTAPVAEQATPQAAPVTESKPLGLKSNQAAPVTEQEKQAPRFSLISGDKTTRTTSPPWSKQAVEVLSKRLFTRLRLHQSGKLSRIVHDTESTLPEPIKKQIESDNAQGTVRGVYYDGAVHIVASNIYSEKDIEEVMLHEAFGHYGVRTLFGQDTRRALIRLFINLGNKEGIKALADKHGINLDAYFKMAEDKPPQYQAMMLTDELLAHLQGAKVYQTLPQKVKTALKEFWGAIRAMFKRAGFKSFQDFTDTDLAYLLQRMAKAAKTGQTTGAFVSDKNDIRFSSEPNSTDTLQIFKDLDSRAPEATREKTLAEVLNHPDHDRIMYVENNFVEILSQLEQLKGFEIKC